MIDEKKMSFLEHLEELRKRLITCAISMFVGMIICWFFREQILSFLLDPLYQAWRQVEGLEEPRPLNYSSMLEPFVANLKLSAVGGLFLSAPVVEPAGRGEACAACPAVGPGGQKSLPNLISSLHNGG